MSRDKSDFIEMEENRTPSPETTKGKASNKKKREPLGKKVEHYFFGPRDIARHSKLPFFFRLHGSVIPHMIIPMLIVGAWASTVTYIIDQKFWEHRFDPILLTVLGFLVGIALSFRNSTAYERYNDGRKYWSQLTLTCENLARVIWIHAREREGEQATEDLLSKVTCLNLIVAFSLALKHRLRFEPYYDYDDIRNYITCLDTYSKDANIGFNSTPPKPSKIKRLGEILGITAAQDNPRKMMKQAKRPLGNLPLEILTYIQGYIDSIIDNGTLKTPIFQVQSITSCQTLNDILTGTDRILNTPLPIAYSITIAQISWAYILLLPFQLYQKLHWNTIPATLLAAYIILGLGLIGTEIENPFGEEVNDLPLETFCAQIQHDIDVIMSRPAPKPKDFVLRHDNMPLYPLSMGSYYDWAERSEEDIRAALKTKILARSPQQTPAMGSAT